MSTYPAEKPVPGVVTFTAQGNRALDRLAANLVEECDGSPTRIADILEQVLSVDLEELADRLCDPLATTTEAGSPPGIPGQATHRRLDRAPDVGGAPSLYPPSVRR